MRLSAHRHGQPVLVRKFHDPADVLVRAGEEHSARRAADDVTEVVGSFGEPRGFDGKRAVEMGHLDLAATGRALRLRYPDSPHGVECRDNSRGGGLCDELPA